MACFSSNFLFPRLVLKPVPWSQHPFRRFLSFYYSHTTMRFSTVTISALLIWTTLATPVPDDTADALATLNELAQLANQTMLDNLSNSTTSKRSQKCTAQNISVRKEWYKWPSVLCQCVMCADHIITSGAPSQPRRGSLTQMLFFASRKRLPIPQQVLFLA